MNWWWLLLGYCAICWALEAQRAWNFIPLLKRSQVWADTNDLSEGLKAAVLAIFCLFMIIIAPIRSPYRASIWIRKKINRYKLRRSFRCLAFQTSDIDTFLNYVDNMSDDELADFNDRLVIALKEAIRCQNQGSQPFEVKLPLFPKNQEEKTYS